jgi:hypothetical protein
MLRSLFVLAIHVPGLVAALHSRFASLLLYLWFALFRRHERLWIDVAREETAKLWSAGGFEGDACEL